VSPGAFAQVNTSAADVLYFLARSLAIDGAGGARALLAGGGGGVGAAVDFTQLPSTRRELCLLDICCGGGLLGLNCSPYVGCVAGVDVAEASIADARANSALNGVPEAAAAWVCGRAESAMEAVLAGARARGATAFTAIVDPPRSGLHPAVVRALRTLKGQRRLVYVSCNAASFVGDAVKLTCPQRKQQAFARGPPFRLVYVVGVDLFPHTRGVEVVGLFERDS
jgi:tRNA (uracil-5-)-methyltransferase